MFEYISLYYSSQKDVNRINVVYYSKLCYLILFGFNVLKNCVINIFNYGFKREGKLNLEERM